MDEQNKLKKIVLPSNVITIIFVILALIGIILYLWCFGEAIRCFICCQGETFYNSLGVVLGIVGSISLASIAFLQLIFTFQSNEKAGIKIEKVYKMLRIVSLFMVLVILTFALLVASLILYLIGNYYICLLLSALQCLLSLYVLIYVCPYFFMSEKSMFSYIRYVMQKEYERHLNENNGLWEFDIKEILIELLRNKNVKDIYDGLKDEGCERYNKTLTTKLFELVLREIENDLVISDDCIGDQLVLNAKEIYSELFDSMPANLSEEEQLEYYSKLTICLYKIEATNEYVVKQIKNEISYILENKRTKHYLTEHGYIKNIILITIDKFKHKDLDLMKEITIDTYSSLKSGEQNSLLLRIFMIISFLLYYFSRVKLIISNDLVELIDAYKNSSIFPAGEVIPTTYNEIFKNVISKYNYGLDIFINDFELVRAECEISETIIFRKNTTIVKELALNWYFMCVINGDVLDTFSNYNVLFDISGENSWKYKALERMVDCCYNSTGDFSLDDVFRDMGSFYLDEKNIFKKFIEKENKDHLFIKYIKSYKSEACEEENK